jgi:hypothetical protein
MTLGAAVDDDGDDLADRQKMVAINQVSTL